MRPIAAVCAVTLAGCISGPGELAPFSDVDIERYRDEIQPILAERCANPTCHGNVRRPLRIFAVHQHRLDAELVPMDGVLDDEELGQNLRRVLAFIITAGSDEVLLTQKPLSRAAGGVKHEGGVQFADTEELEYKTLRRWAQEMRGRLDTEALP